MPDDRSALCDDKDAVHILPLAMLPLETGGLRRARLVKNTRLDGMVELFSGASSGSGQVQPNHLYKCFDFGRRPHPDVELVTKLSRLPSFDVYSLRLQLRRMGVEIEDHDNLKLSDAQTSRLSVYMRIFLRPLIKQIYGDAPTNAWKFADLIKMISGPEVDVAKENLTKLSFDLQIRIDDLTTFISDYADAYLSLSYYQYCFDQSKPTLVDFFECLDEVVRDDQVKFNPSKVAACRRIETKLRTIESDINFVLGAFTARTEKMWDGITAQKYNSMKLLVQECQVNIGAAICALTVKMSAWSKAFPYRTPGGVPNMVDFIVAQIGYGLDSVPEIKYSDEG